MLRPSASLTSKLIVGTCSGLCVVIFLNKMLVEPFCSDYTHESSPIQGNEIAEKLGKEVRILCWILTGPENHATKAIHVKQTWGRRFNKFLMMSSVEDKTIGTIGLANVSEGRDWLWAKTKAAFAYVWEHHRDEADWFMKADDDTFVVVENLRKFLQDKSPSDPVYFGCPFCTETKPIYSSGGSGFVLSKEALRRFVEVGLPNSSICQSYHGGAADLEMGNSLRKLGVYLDDSRDVWGRYRFLALSPSFHLFPEEKNLSFWYWENIVYPQEQGLQSCANDAISFHYVSPQEMYVYEYFLYHLRPYGINIRSKEVENIC